jgi:hypothetical protein
MDISANIAATIDKRRQERKKALAARRLLLVAVIVGMAVSAAASVRVAAVTWATPIDSWMEGYPTLLDPGLEVRGGTQNFAARASSIIADAGLIRGLQPICFKSGLLPSSPHDQAPRRDTAACLELVDVALQAAPASGELWLFKASKLASDGRFDEPMMNALRNTYRTSPAEGWLAAERVVLGLTLYPTLAADLQERVRSDLKLVLHHTRLSRPLIVAYLANPTLRAAADMPLHELPEDAIKSFVEMVRAATSNR